MAGRPEKSPLGGQFPGHVNRVEFEIGDSFQVKEREDSRMVRGGEEGRENNGKEGQLERLAPLPLPSP